MNLLNSACRNAKSLDILILLDMSFKTHHAPSQWGNLNPICKLQNTAHTPSLSENKFNLPLMLLHSGRQQRNSTSPHITWFQTRSQRIRAHPIMKRYWNERSSQAGQTQAKGHQSVGGSVCIHPWTAFTAAVIMLKSQSRWQPVVFVFFLVFNQVRSQYR